MAIIALVACVKEKRNSKTAAIDMYCSDDFKMWISNAKDRKADHIYILSGKYGLLKPEDHIEPYDLNLNQASESYHVEWSNNIIRKLRSNHDLKNDHFIFYTNARYASRLIDEIVNFEFPFNID